jgi:hypothetical protein
MKKILLNNNKSNNKQENQILPPLNKGDINSRAQKDFHANIYMQLSTSHLQVHRTKTKEKEQVADRLLTRIGATARRRFPAVARTVPSPGRLHTFQWKEPIYIPRTSSPQKQQVKIGSGAAGRVKYLSINLLNPPPKNPKTKKKISLFCRLWYRNLVYIQIPPQFYRGKGSKQGNKYI